MNRKGRRLWFLGVVAFLAASAIATVRLWPELERNFQGWLMLAIAALALMLVLFWFALLSRFPWRVRLITVAALGLAGFGFSKAVRVTGTTSASTSRTPPLVVAAFRTRAGSGIRT